jgi:predicted O-methyltransferase YrrM
MIIDALKELEKESISRKIPIIGQLKGEWLIKTVQSIKPKRVLELGTANGYSGCILGSTGADITTVEQDEKIALEAQKNFEKFKINAHIMVGDGVKFVRSLADHPDNKGSFDIIFIDFSKKKYISVLEDCIKIVRHHGLIIADNITMDGCKDYKNKVLNDPRLKTEIVTIKDGLACSMKLN